MSNVVVEQIKQRAIAAGKTIVIPEAQDDRVLQAAQDAAGLRYAHVQVVGSPQEIAARAKTLGLDLSNVEVVDHSQGQLRDRCVQHVFERRKAKGMTLDQAADLLKSPIYFGGAMVGVGVADGMVAGSVSPTADTVRSALYAVGCKEGNRTVSSCSVMNSIIPEFGVDGSVIFADTGVVPEPTTEQLADIAIAAAEACRQLLNTEPYVAMMSFSTKGSAYSPAVQKVIDATAIAQKRRPDLKIDGELQVDAAMMPDIAARKAKGSPVAGRANTLVFPDLSCGNIAYKLVERFGKAEALGPLLLGLAKPINDLSRGCSVEDIVLITAITALQAG